LIKQILSFTRGRRETRAIISVGGVLSELTRMLRHTFPKSIDIQAVLPQGIPSIHADLTQLHQILMNLCVNARDAMSEGGTLHLEAGSTELKAPCPGFPDDIPAGQYTVLKVSDTGSGIDDDTLSKIFEPFFTTKPVDQGSGLGLFTVRKLVSEHNGFIRVISRVGQGSCFELYFPALHEHNAKALPAVPFTELPRGKGEMILVVDDEHAMLEIIEAILKKFGYNVLLATNGVEALSLFARQKDQIGVAIVDIMMPLLDGVATIAALQKISPQINLIAISGLATNATVCRSLPRTQFLQKPFALDQLLAAVKQALTEAPLSLPIRAAA
jgi:two-component system cell cycle sensor histidine kinase/response regulator CckA